MSNYICLIVSPPFAFCSQLSQFHSSSTGVYLLNIPCSAWLDGIVQIYISQVIHSLVFNVKSRRSRPMAISNIPDTSLAPVKDTEYDPTRCTVNSGGSSCEACLTLAKIDSETLSSSSAYGRTSGVEYRKRALKTQINQRHDPFIHRMPVEIASQIFVSFLEDESVVGNDCFLRSSTRELAWFAPLLLASVCHTWRKIALSTPQLWTFLHVHLSDASSVPTYTDLTRRWLRRTGQLPLSISLSFSGTYASHTVSPLFDVIRECSSRWRQLSLRISTNYYDKLVHGLEVLPSLEEILLHPPTESVWSSAIDSFGVGRTPSLHHLEVSNLSLAKIPIQWDLLTTFEATDIFLADIMGLLRVGQRLLRCKFVKISGSIGIFPLVTSELITNPSLKELSIHPNGDISAKLDLLLTRLVLPNLERFECDFSASRDNLPVESLSGLFGRSQCPLKYFALRSSGVHTRMIDASLMRVLQEVPTVTHLAIFTECAVPILSNGFLQHLAKPMLSSSQAGAEFLPHLEMLEFHGRRTFSWSSLVQVAQAANQESPIDGTTVALRRPIHKIQFKLFHQLTDPLELILSEVREQLVGAQNAGVFVEVLDADGSDLLAM
ncbi:hypothetical protein BDN70DRAFT_866582 [Pholiota conissans]|uniref:F-box domain-containing protein n=1 Tax=Pholiota conissans TaxID=109636 RepID=A0A9P5YS89_9AGAR|nr:hypothetical protein BDN70DRAFT_866582 [Pholiota conissans]